MKDTSIMQMAYITAQSSKCLSYKVGAVIAKNSRIIATGRNGTAQGMDNPDEVAFDRGWAEQVNVPGKNESMLMLLEKHSDEYSAWAKGEIIHAEINAMLFAARNGTAIQGATMYCTLSPCVDCAKAIAQSGIKRLVYCDEYSHCGEGWVFYLKNAGIDVVKLDKSSLDMLNWDNVISKQPRVEIDE